MFHQYILTFIQVAELKSFSAVAKKNHLTPNAVKKRIEALERETGLLLFHRTNQGCFLTEAGAAFHQDVLSIEKHYTAAVSNATYVQNNDKNTLLIGLMSTFEDSFMTSTWYDIRNKTCAQKIQTIHYGSSLSDMDEMFQKVGAASTMCIDVYDEKLAETYQLTVEKISSFSLYIGFPHNTGEHLRRPVPLEVLSECTIACLMNKRAKVFDDVRRELYQKAKNIHISDLEKYTVRSVNECFMKQQLILIPQNLISLYPFYTFVPLNIHQTVDFGLYYKKRDTKKINDFLRNIQQ